MILATAQVPTSASPPADAAVLPIAVETVQRRVPDDVLSPPESVPPVDQTSGVPPVAVPPPVEAVPQTVPPATEPVPVEPLAMPVDPTTPQPDVVVLGRSRRGDPLESVNAQSFDATQSVDRAVVGPVALAYKKSVPAPIRDGLRNFLANLREPVVFVNYLLQLKPGKAGETLGRFAVNTTVGAAGLFDVAKRKPFRLPRRRNGFANTLGYYGVKPGPFFFLPLIGATTLRDLLGNGIDQFVPIGPIRPFSGTAYTVPIAVLSALDYRAEIDEDLERLRAKQDPYAAVRRFYLERRQAEIDALRGEPPKADAPRSVWPRAVLDTDPVPSGN